MLIIGQDNRVVRDPDFVSYEKLPEAFGGFALLAIKHNHAVIIGAYPDLNTVKGTIDQITQAELAGYSHIAL